MNAGQEFSVRMQLGIYRIINDVLEEDYNAWIKMDKEELMGIVMKRLQGHVNPIRLRKIIEDL